MRIDDLRADHVGTPSGKPVAPARKAGAPRPGAAEAAARGDSVEISAEARALAANGAAGDVAGALAPERLAELRRWLAGGGHNDPGVLRHVAARLIAGGELDENRVSEGSES